MSGGVVWPGSAYPLGATWDGTGVNFALFSAYAERVELCLFDDDEQEMEIDLEFSMLWGFAAADPEDVD